MSENKRVCVVCGKLIPPTRHKLSNTCSNLCAYEHSLERNRKYREDHRVELAAKARKYRPISPPKCKKCGNEFQRIFSAQKYCSKCRQERIMKNFKPPKRNISLAEAARIAKEHGLSYGQAVAAGLI